MKKKSHSNALEIQAEFVPHLLPLRPHPTSIASIVCKSIELLDAGWSEAQWQNWVKFRRKFSPTEGTKHAFDLHTFSGCSCLAQRQQ